MSVVWEGKKLEVWNMAIWKFPDNRNQTWVLLSHTLRVFIRSMIWKFSLERNSFCVRFVTQLQISKISIKTSKAWTLMFSLWGCLSDTWFEYSFRKETFLCHISNSASNLKHFYQDIYLKNEHGCFHFLGFDLTNFRYLCREETVLLSNIWKAFSDSGWRAKHYWSQDIIV